MAKNLPAMQETHVQSLGEEAPWRREWLPTQASLPGEFHGQRSQAVYSLWGHKELETMELLTVSYTPWFPLCRILLGFLLRVLISRAKLFLI